MVKLYVSLIRKGLRTVEQVPERIREAVRNELGGDEYAEM